MPEVTMLALVDLELTAMKVLGVDRSTFGGFFGLKA